MRIIGGKDYYDGCAMFGIDPGIVFVRDGKFSADIGVLEEKSGPWIVNDTEGRNRFFFANHTLGQFDHLKLNLKMNSVRGFNVIFSGKNYKGVRCSIQDERMNITDHFFYDNEKFNDFLKDYGLKSANSSRFSLIENDVYFTHRQLSAGETETLLKLGIVNAISRNAFRSSRSPFDGLKASDDKRWIVNSDKLKDVGFASVVDGYTAHQEIMMWVGTMKSAPENMITISDDNVKVAKHGFDEWSFRKKVR